jgi:FixJ family two-component response regulator
MSLKPQLTKRSNIIIIDDEEATVHFAAVILKEIGFERVKTFTSVKKFTDSDLIFNAELIFLDINLHDMNGLVLLAWIKVKRPSAAVVMFSGDTRIELVKEAKKVRRNKFFIQIRIR